MRKGLVGLVVILGCGALLMGGCAKREAVRSEPVAPLVAPVKPPAAQETVKEQVVQEAPVKEATVKEQPVAEVAKPAGSDAVLAKVYFDFDSAALSDAARDTLKKNADYMKRFSGQKIQIEGHCDERGSDEYNLALGEKRAKAVMSYLATLGVPASRLSVISYGKEKPADPGHDEAAWAKNRRAEFIIVSK